MSLGTSEYRFLFILLQRLAHIHMQTWMLSLAPLSLSYLTFRATTVKVLVEFN